MRHEQNIRSVPVKGLQAYCSCGWESTFFKTAVVASELGQAHAEEQHPREPTDVEIYGAGSA